LFEEEFFEQVDGVAMGSPLAPILANLFMWHHEKDWLNNYTAEILFYQRYVCDIFCLFNNKNDALHFFERINNKHSNIKFTMEEQSNNVLPFLDVSINNSNNNTKTSIYRKKTFIGLFTNYLSFSPIKYKLGLVKTLLDRIYKINNTWIGFHEDIVKLKNCLNKNAYPTEITDKCQLFMTTNLVSDLNIQLIMH